MFRFEKFEVWQRAVDFACKIYTATGRFPADERFGLTSQMRRAAVSVPSNIAEGKGHRSNKEFVHYLFHARGSLLELQTQILVAEELRYVSGEQGSCLLAAAENISRALNGLITSLGTDK